MVLKSIASTRPIVFNKKQGKDINELNVSNIKNSTVELTIINTCSANAPVSIHLHINPSLTLQQWFSKPAISPQTNHSDRHKHIKRTLFNDML